jgi:hypothetical protein
MGAFSAVQLKCELTETFYSNRIGFDFPDDKKKAFYSSFGSFARMRRAWNASALPSSYTRSRGGQCHRRIGSVNREALTRTEMLH